jgi:hypothetical protein
MSGFRAQLPSQHGGFCFLRGMTGWLAGRSRGNGPRRGVVADRLLNASPFHPSWSVAPRNKHWVFRGHRAGTHHRYRDMVTMAIKYANFRMPPGQYTRQTFQREGIRWAGCLCAVGDITITTHEDDSLWGRQYIHLHCQNTASCPTRAGGYLPRRVMSFVGLKGWREATSAGLVHFMCCLSLGLDEEPLSRAGDGGA